jgi:hypothetical protein
MNGVPIRSWLETVGGRACRTLPLLAREAPRAAARLRRWRGASGRDYLVSIYSLERCPDYSEAVLIAVSAEGSAVWIGDTIGGGEALRQALADAAAAGAVEVHLHLLAADAASRLDVVRDLSEACRPGIARRQ